MCCVTVTQAPDSASIRVVTRYAPNYSMFSSDLGWLLTLKGRLDVATPPTMDPARRTSANHDFHKSFTPNKRPRLDDNSSVGGKAKPTLPLSKAFVSDFNGKARLTTPSKPNGATAASAQRPLILLEAGKALSAAARLAQTPKPVRHIPALDVKLQQLASPTSKHLPVDPARRHAPLMTPMTPLTRRQQPVPQSVLPGPAPPSPRARSVKLSAMSSPLSSRTRALDLSKATAASAAASAGSVLTTPVKKRPFNAMRVPVTPLRQPMAASSSSTALRAISTPKYTLPALSTPAGDRQEDNKPAAAGPTLRAISDLAYPKASSDWDIEEEEEDGIGAAEARELRRGLHMSPEKAGGRTRKFVRCVSILLKSRTRTSRHPNWFTPLFLSSFYFVHFPIFHLRIFNPCPLPFTCRRNGLAEHASHLVKRANTGFGLWQREIEVEFSASRKMRPDRRLRVVEVLQTSTSSHGGGPFPSRGGGALHSVLSRCELLGQYCKQDHDQEKNEEDEERLLSEGGTTRDGTETRDLDAKSREAVQVLFTFSGESHIRTGGIPVGAEVQVWKPWFEVTSPPLPPAGFEGEGRPVPVRTLLCSRFLVLPS